MNQKWNPTRRNFLKTSAVGAATAVAASTLINSSVYAAGDDTIKVALIGCGGRGSGACSQALSTKGPVKLIAVADAFKDNAENGLRNLQAKHPDRIDVPADRIFSGFDAYKQAVDSDAHLIIIATPPGFRPIHFEYAVEKGKNVFAEKPVSTDPPGIRRFLAAAKVAREKNLKVGIGLQRHHDPKYIETVSRIQDGALGDLILMRAYWNDSGVWVRPRKQLAENKKNAGGGELTEMEYQMRNWYYFNWLCGDHINEQHIHNLDVINWIKKGPPATAQGQGGRQIRTGIDNGEIYDHHFVEFTYPDGTVLLSQCRHTPNAWNSVSEHAHGTKGISDVGAGYLKLKEGGDWRWKGKPVDPYQQEHDDLFAAIRDDKPYMEAEYGATSTMTSIMGRMATYTGRLIKWEDALNSTISIMPKTYAWDANPPTLPDANGRYRIPMEGIEVNRVLETLPANL